MGKKQQPLKAGDRVSYLAHLDHWHEDGGTHFLFELVEDGPPPPLDSTARRQRKGDIAEGDVGTVESRDAEGILRTSKGFTLRVLRARQMWPATVREEATGLVLDVRHPNGIVTLHLPLATVPHDPTGTQPHTWHHGKESE